MSLDNNVERRLLVAASGLLVCFLLLGGCATTPKDYSTLSDGQLTAEHARTVQEIANAEAEIRSLQAQAAYATTPEQAAAYAISAAIVGSHLKTLRRNQAGAMQEALRRDGQRKSYTAAPPSPTKGSQPQGPPGPQAKHQTLPEIKGKAAAPPVAVSEYAGGSRGHWIDQVLSNGRFVVLEDGSVWEIDPIDTINSSLWLGADNIILAKEDRNDAVCHIINTDSNDSAHGDYLGMVISRAAIDGDFEGWDGDTVFVLDDGTVLKQARHDYTYHYAYCPDVLLVDQGDALILVVDGVDETIGVVVIR